MPDNSVSFGHFEQIVKRAKQIDAQLRELYHRVTDCETHIKRHGDENGSYTQQLFRMGERMGDLQKFAENLEVNDRRRAVAVRQIQDRLAQPKQREPRRPDVLYVVVDTSAPGVEEFYAVFYERDRAESYIEDFRLSGETYKLEIIEANPLK